MKRTQEISGTGYADIKKGYEEVIDTFSITSFFTHKTQNVYFLPITIYNRF